MFTWIFKLHFFRTLKSGFIFDFLIKKISYYILRWNFIVYNVFFSEKYFVEYFILRLKKITQLLFLFIDTFNNEYAVRILTISLFVIFLILFLTLNVKFT